MPAKTPKSCNKTHLPHLRDVIAQYNLEARRSLGQHFLLDLNLTRRIVKSAGDLNNQSVIEIGPGPGGLTRALLETSAKEVIAVERDERCIKGLKTLVNTFPERLKIIEADALKLNLTNLAHKDKIKVVANLPYNVSIPLLIGWLRQLSAIKSMTLMFQKEVADRISAKPGTRGYGRTSVIAQWLCEVETVFCIPARAFVPPPKVVSAVVNFTPRLQPLAPASFKILEKVTAAAFGQRRKMLRSALKTLHPYPIDLLKRANINPEARAETLTVEQFCMIAESYRELVLPKISQ
jgi:16S rRNA (adenine1518-N6/adenine1519-N6)-dimethyltransferase